MNAAVTSDPPPLVRVVILNYNQPSLTVRCAASVLAQKEVRIDLTVVDNWSNAAQLSQLRAGLPKEAALAENSENLGYAAGNNAGLRSTPPQSEFALVLNNDVVLTDPLTIATMAGALREDSSLAACSPLVHDEAVSLPPQASIQIRRIPNFWELVVVSSSVLRRLPRLRAINRGQVYGDRMPFPVGSVVPCETVNGCCFLIRSSILKTIGYLDEGTFLYCEELILGFQLRARGLGCALVTRTVVDHQQGASTGRNAAGASAVGMFRRMRSETYFARKYLNAGLKAPIVLGFVCAIDMLCKAAHAPFRRRT
jgi:GT2 family glycosyltransferase